MVGTVIGLGGYSGAWFGCVSLLGFGCGFEFSVVC